MTENLRLEGHVKDSNNVPFKQIYLYFEINHLMIDLFYRKRVRIYTVTSKYLIYYINGLTIVHYVL